MQEHSREEVGGDWFGGIDAGGLSPKEQVKALGWPHPHTLRRWQRQIPGQRVGRMYDWRVFGGKSDETQRQEPPYGRGWLKCGSLEDLREWDTDGESRSPTVRVKRLKDVDGDGGREGLRVSYDRGLLMCHSWDCVHGARRNGYLVGSNLQRFNRVIEEHDGFREAIGKPYFFTATVRGVGNRKRTVRQALDMTQKSVQSLTQGRQRENSEKHGLGMIFWRLDDTLSYRTFPEGSAHGHVHGEVWIREDDWQRTAAYLEERYLVKLERLGGEAKRKRGFLVEPVKSKESVALYVAGGPAWKQSVLDPLAWEVAGARKESGDSSYNLEEAIAVMGQARAGRIRMSEERYWQLVDWHWERMYGYKRRNRYNLASAVNLRPFLGEINEKRQRRGEKPVVVPTSWRLSEIGDDPIKGGFDPAGWNQLEKAFYEELGAERVENHEWRYLEQQNLLGTLSRLIIDSIDLNQPQQWLEDNLFEFVKGLMMADAGESATEEKGKAQ
ncbi:MAG: hypothetical protein OXR67_02040 [Chloroflexota bacterium]|nr:hypothetical protein [Chloroflexota bacterium]